MSPQGATPPLDVQKATRQDAKVTDWRTSWSDFDWEVWGSLRFQLFDFNFFLEGGMVVGPPEIRVS